MSVQAPSSPNHPTQSVAWSQRLQDWIFYLFDYISPTFLNFIHRPRSHDVVHLNPSENDLCTFVNELQEEIERLKAEKTRAENSHSQQTISLNSEIEKLRQLNEKLALTNGQLEARLQSERRAVKENFLQQLGVKSLEEAKLLLATGSMLRLQLEELYKQQP